MVLVNGRWLPPAPRRALPDHPCVGLIGDQVAFVALGAQELGEISFPALAHLLTGWRHTLPAVEVGGQMIEYPWDLVDANADALRADFAAYREAPRQHPTLAVIGTPHNCWIAPSARVEPLVVADTTHGPVVIEEHAVVSAFTRLEGPCYVGAHSQVLGAKVRGGTTIGPNCRVGGEVEASIIHGFSNKYHEGFLGHSYVGAWVNLGAGTHNSDLRNDYGTVSVPMPGRVVGTGRSKVGCFIGDHAKTGLGTLINTGSHLGAFCNLLPAGRLCPKYVPAFTTWWNGQLSEEFPLDQLLHTAERMMRRRGQQLSHEFIDLAHNLYEATAGERSEALEGNTRRPWRRSG
jgi:UDP-N-acetylglucosamine diphosphorylase/glucosamine-1-phosphate N-acetyltransferase